MCSSPQAESSSPTARWDLSRYGGDTAVFLLRVYLYAWLVIDPHLIHHSLGILSYYYPFSFHTGETFLWEHLVRPGGLVEYAVRLLSQAFEFGWCGALVLAAVAWHTCWSTDAVSRFVGRPRGHVLRYVPTVLLLAVYGSYSHPLGAVLSLSVGLTSFAAYARWAPRKTLPRIATLVLVSASLYHFAGSGSLVFPAMVAIYELLVSRRPIISVVGLCSGAILPWLAATLFCLDIDWAYGGFFLSDPGLLPGKWPFALALYLFFPVTLAGIALVQAILAKRASRVSKRRRDKAGAGNRKRLSLPQSIMATRCLQAALVLLGAGATAWFSLDTLTRTVLEIDDHSQHERWAEALAAADRFPADFYDVRCNRNVMLALYHTGRMGDEMFRYPQRPGVDLFRTPDDVRDLGTYFQEGRLFLDMGHVNQAEKCFCEALETCGDMPAILEHLALVNVVKGRPETARIFLNALARHPLQRHAAREMLGRLEADPEMDDDPRVSRIRGSMAERDFVDLNTGVEEFLLALLERNPRNRMALELLMAHYLIIGRPDGVVAAFPQLEDLAYTRMPRHYQEAAAIQSRSTGVRRAVSGCELDGAVLARAGQFASIVALARNRQRAMQTALDAGFGDTYFFYLTFGVSGLRQDEE